MPNLIFGIRLPPWWCFFVGFGLLYGVILLQWIFGVSEWSSVIGVSGVIFFEIAWWWVNRTNWRYYAMFGLVIAAAFLNILLFR